MEDCDFVSQMRPYWRRSHCPKLVVLDGCRGANNRVTEVGTLREGPEEPLK